MKRKRSHGLDELKKDCNGIITTGDNFMDVVVINCECIELKKGKRVNG